MAGVISMSGSATSPFAIDSDPQGATKELAEKNGCPLSPVVTMVKCLQQLPVEKLIQADSVVEVCIFSLNNLPTSVRKKC